EPSLARSFCEQPENRSERDHRSKDEKTELGPTIAAAVTHHHPDQEDRSNGGGEKRTARSRSRKQTSRKRKPVTSSRDRRDRYTESSHTKEHAGAIRLRDRTELHDHTIKGDEGDHDQRTSEAPTPDRKAGQDELCN